MQAARAALPICAVRKGVSDGLVRSDVVVVSGETGCGKTTQVGGLGGRGGVRARWGLGPGGWGMMG